MPLSKRARKWFGWPSRTALLLGIGAVSAAGGAQADAASLDRSDASARVPQQSVADFGEVRIWSDAGRIYVSEQGREARELRLGDTAEARNLKALLESSGATAAAPQTVPHRIILVGGGGMGTHWSPGGQSDAHGQTPANGAGDQGQPRLPAADTQRRDDRGGAAAGTTAPGAQKG